MSNSVARSPIHVCKSCPYFSNCERMCRFGMRSMIITSMTKKNPIRRYAWCKRFDRPGGCEFFDWVDDSLCDRFRSTVVGLMNQNDALAAEKEQLKNVIRQNEAGKKETRRMKDDSGRNLSVYGC